MRDFDISLTCGLSGITIEGDMAFLDELTEIELINVYNKMDEIMKHIKKSVIEGDCKK